MQRFRARIDGTVLALIALATLFFASFGHVHGIQKSNSEVLRLECRLPVAVSSKPQCPSDTHNHLDCSVCLAASFAGAAVAPTGPVIDQPVHFTPIDFESQFNVSAPLVSTSPFQARGPPQSTLA